MAYPSQSKDPKVPDSYAGRGMTEQVDDGNHEENRDVLKIISMASVKCIQDYVN